MKTCPLHRLTMTRASRSALGALALILAAASASCGTPTEPDLSEGIRGEWIWRSATGGIAGTTTTPESTGEDLRLEFFGDHEVELRRNGVAAIRTTYVLSSGAEGDADEIRYAQPLFGWESQSVALSPPDTLVLTDPCCDGFTYTFLRAKGGRS